MPENAAIGTQTLTVTAPADRPPADAAGRGHARQGPAGQAHARAAAALSCAAPRSRASSTSSRSRTTAAAISSSALAAQAPQNFETSFTEQYGSQELSPFRSRPARPRTSSSRCAPPNTVGARQLSGRRRGSAPRTPSATTERRARDHRPAEARHRRPRRPAVDAALTAGKESLDPDRRHQHRHRAGRRDRAHQQRRRAAGRSPSSRRPSTASRPNANKEVQALVTPTGEGDRRRLRDRPSAPRRAARPPHASSASRSATSTMWGIAGVGIIARRAADHGRRGREVRPPMSDTVIEAQGLTKRYGRVDRRRRHLVHGRARRDLRPARAERRGQDHDHPDDARPDRDVRRQRAACSATIRRASRSQVKRRVGYLPDTVGFYDHMTARRQSALHRAR